MDKAPKRLFEYPEDLPVSRHREEICRLLSRNQTVIVCGDTGSGKTTQLPKMAMELGRGMNGRLIACTQPRRLAAMTVAARVAQEIKTELGGTIGFQHRFDRRLSASTRVKFMTDGILLAETKTDPLLMRYDTVIVDEAHERTLNIDFLLGILKRILPRRPDLKVIVSSATLDTRRFSAFFGGAPAIEVPGRLFPVEIRHAGGEDEETQDLPRDVAAALRTLPADADTLVFLPGERDIRETADRLARTPELRGDEIIPLLASLPAGEQQRAFRLSANRRIILSTNVAETSITIPGIRAVIDSGLARISRFVPRTKVQRLQIEKISQASAKQRAGRCGRTGPGICIRLYGKDDFESREPFTPPEIQRSSLAGVILTMMDLKMGDITDFPFIDPPRPASVREGLRELLEIGAIHHDASGAMALTKTGRSIARIPVEPRLARMLLAASSRATLPSAIPIVAAMSCDDPRRRPAEEREKADAAHAAFRERGSDFLGTLKLWRRWEKESETSSQSQLRKFAQKNYLSYPKMREWKELVRQLTDLSRRIGLDTENDNGGPAALHMALMSGLLARIGHLHPEDLDYRGAHGTRFIIHPGSALAKERKAKPEWIMAGELVDTARLYARSAAIIDPSWIEPVAGPVCKHSFREPFWDAEHGFVRAIEQVTLYGLVIVPSRRRDFTKIDPATSRRLFIFHGLVEGEFPDPPAPVRENSDTIRAIRERAERLRETALFDAERLAAFFDAAIPPGIASAGELKKWLAAASAEEKNRFRLKRNEWLPAAGGGSRDFPPHIKIAGAKIALSYRHAPDDPETDGITATVREGDLGALRAWRSDWLVPGALPLKLHFLLDSLPSSIRRAISPVSDTVAIIMPLLSGKDMPLADAVREVVLSRFGIRIPAGAFDRISLPPHLKVRFIVTDENGEQAAVTRDVEKLFGKSGVAPRKSAAEIAAERPSSLKAKEKKELESRIRTILLEAKALPDDIYDCIETQIAWLTYPDWDKLVPPERLKDYPRYLKALETRISRARTNPSGDRSKEARFDPWWEQYVELVSGDCSKIADSAALADYRWLLEEYRISLFAQETGTRVPASPNRLAALWVQATVR
ncbi:MAG: ATP-dependent RNA helicase HrpA [Kiritimatiellae bacterium]|nr:ATP-dependent RNA helicase HrpA [Kiritimatiellia bacterium]